MVHRAGQSGGGHILKKCIPNREIDELGEGLVMIYIRKTGMKVLPKRHSKAANAFSHEIAYISGAG